MGEQTVYWGIHRSSVDVLVEGSMYPEHSMQVSGIVAPVCREARKGRKKSLAPTSGKGKETWEGDNEILGFGQTL